MDFEKLNKIRIGAEDRLRPQMQVWFIPVAVAFAAIVSGLLAFSKGDERRIFDGTQKNNTAAIVPQPISATPAQSENTALTVSGHIVPNARIEVSPRFQGVVSWVGVKKGDPVKKGQELVRLEDSEERAALVQAEGRLEAARVSLKKAETEYRRTSQLSSKRIESELAGELAGLAVEAAQAVLMEAGGACDAARVRLSFTVIRSPVDGVILDTWVDAGELVSPLSFGGARAPSTALLALADLSDLRVELDLSEADLSKVRIGHPCRIIPEAYPDKVYRGSVAEISPEANRQKGTLQAKVKIEKPDSHLVPELGARVEFLEK